MSSPIPKVDLPTLVTADRFVRLWNREGQMLLRIKDYPEPLRGLSILPSDAGDVFASACNDGLIRICDYEGAVLGILRGHSDSVFQLAQSSSGDLISCGEDHTAVSSLSF